MARILLGCELGNGYGHLTRLLPLALALRERGHEPVFAINDLTKAEAVLGTHGLAMLPCPQWRNRVDGLPPMRNFTDILLRFGFVEPTGLRGLARAWMHLVTLLQPALLVLDHSPVALFATRNSGVPRVRFGDGFCCPPLQTPMPPFEWWQARSEAFDTIGERNALHVGNLASAELGLPAADSVAQLLRADDEFLCTFAELDHYGARDGGHYVGPVLDPGQASGPAMPWPTGDGPCAFVYLRPVYPHLESLLAALQAGGWRAVLHVPGLPSARAKALSSERLQFSPTALPMAEVRQRCDAAITHGGYGTTHALLLAGKPQLLLPRQMEQAMLGRRLQALGAGLVAESSGRAPDFGDLLGRLQSDTALTAAAVGFAQGHASHNSQRVVADLVQRCESLLQGQPPATDAA